MMQSPISSSPELIDPRFSQLRLPASSSKTKVPTKEIESFFCFGSNHFYCTLIDSKDADNCFTNKQKDLELKLNENSLY
ncbi:CLUMA_CG002848, isoform A [Clunio marinus]|uniref:CLUMA_CG002848, isoform A n=1 Tax=Clunio marinus TaxID=568069 RepID=A0A1J1HLI4_9DIPT|nr:CLUMA_CG002848, isoform A [Clunio marinus]